MAWTKPYQYANYVGEHADDATALAFIKSIKWDSNGDGTGNAQAGMLYYNTTSNRVRWYNGSGWVEIVPGGYTGVQVYFFGKHGDDANDGKSPENAKETIGSACTAAGSPLETAKVIIRGLDGGTYSENVTIPQNTMLYAPAATIAGYLTFGTNSNANIYRFSGQSSVDYTLQFNSGTAASCNYCKIQEVYHPNRNVCLVNTAGSVYFDVDKWTSAGSTSYSAIVHQAGTIYGQIKNFTTGGHSIYAYGSTAKKMYLTFEYINVSSYGGRFIKTNSDAKFNGYIKANYLYCYDWFIDNDSSEGSDNFSVEIDINHAYIGTGWTAVDIKYGKLSGRIGELTSIGTLFTGGAGSIIDLTVGTMISTGAGSYIANLAYGSEFKLSANKIKYSKYFVNSTHANNKIDISTNYLEATDTGAAIVGVTASAGEVRLNVHNNWNLHSSGSTPWSISSTAVFKANITELSNYNTSYPPTSNSNTEVYYNKGNSTISSATHYDDLNVVGIKTIFVDTTSNDVTIGGFSGGTKGQTIEIIKTVTANNLIIEYAEDSGTQQIYIEGSGDKSITDWGIAQLVCDGSNWFYSP